MLPLLPRPMPSHAASRFFRCRFFLCAPAVYRGRRCIFIADPGIIVPEEHAPGDIVPSRGKAKVQVWTTCRDLVWGFLNSTSWGVFLLLVSLATVLYRPVGWFVGYGPGDRNHSAISGRLMFSSTYFIHIINSLLYHLLARPRFRAPVQRAMLKRVRASELTIIGAVTLGTVVFTAIGRY